MRAFLYGVSLQWRLDIRSRTLLTTCYLVPLLFFAVMGGIFTSILPGAGETLIPAMTVFGVTMGALIGLPPSLVEIYGSDIRKVYKANGVPLYLGLVLTNLSAFLHLFLMSLIICAVAPITFDAKIPEHPASYVAGLVVLIASSLGVASVIGLAVRDQAKTSMYSILVFLPSTLLSGIMFPVELLPDALVTAGKIFPASWGYELLAEGTLRAGTLLPPVLMLVLAAGACVGLLRRVRE